MILFSYHQDPKNLTIGNYYLDAAKTLDQPVAWTTPLMHPWAQENLEPNVILRIDDGHPDFVNYKKLCPKTVFVCIDTHTDFNRVHRIAQNCHITFAAQLNGVEKLKSLGIDAHWLPCACDPNVHTSMYSRLSDRPVDIGFAGSLSSHWYRGRREELLEKIRAKFSNTLITTTNRGQLSIVNGLSKIVINQALDNDINMRVFEAMSAGAFLFTEKIEDNGFKELELDRYCLTWETTDEAIDKLQSLLSNIDELDSKAKTAQEFMHTKHTYTHRLKKIFETIRNL